MNTAELSELLLAARLSQRQAARLIGVNERTIRRYCAGFPILLRVEQALRYVIGSSGCIAGSLERR